MTVAMHQDTTDLAPLGDTSLGRWVSVLAPAAALAERIANTDFVPEAMRGNAAMVTAAIMYGDELGVGPMQALSGINVIRGKPSPSSELMRALVFRAGHTMSVLKSDGASCRVVGKRAGQRDGTVIEWSLEMARAAGLIDSNPTWRRYPRAMLLARATSELCRVLFPDVVKGLGHVVDDESTAQGFDDWAAIETGKPTPPEQETSTVSRRKPPLAKPLPSGAQGQPVQDHELPDDGYAPAPSRQPLDAPTTPWEPPPGVEQPPLPDMPAQPPQAPSAGSGPSTPVSPSPEPVDGPLPTPDDAQPPATGEQDRTLKRVHVMFSELGLSDEDRPLKLAIASAAIGRNVTSSKFLTFRERLKLVGTLDDLINERLTFGVLADGSVEIYPLETEPDQ